MLPKKYSVREINNFPKRYKVHNFSKDISPKVTVIGLLDIGVPNVNHYAMEIPLLDLVHRG